MRRRGKRNTKTARKKCVGCQKTPQTARKKCVGMPKEPPKRCAKNKMPQKMQRFCKLNSLYMTAFVDLHIKVAYK